MTSKGLVPRDDSYALGSDSTWDPERRPQRPARPAAPVRRAVPGPSAPTGAPLPVVVYLATDFRPGPLDNGQIGILSLIQTAARAQSKVVRWEPGASPLDGKAYLVDPTDETQEPRLIDVEYIRSWPHGVTIVASWPGNEEIVQAATIVFTGVAGEPRIVRDASNYQLHKHDRYAGFGSGIDYAARRRRYG